MILTYTTWPLDFLWSVMAADQQLQQLDDALRKVEADIENVEGKIEHASLEILRLGPANESPEVRYWMMKEEQLRKEKEQLRKEKELLLELRLVEAKGKKACRMVRRWTLVGGFPHLMVFFAVQVRAKQR